MVDHRLRDRDAIITHEEIIFRVYGYSHPPRAFICDPEYAPSSLYNSKDPKALRSKGKRIYYKFYADEGLRFVRRNYPQHTVWHEPLGRKLVGVHEENIKKTRQPGKALQSLLRQEPEDPLLQALHSLLDLVTERTSLTYADLGVFGSLLNRFYHPMFSDLDFVVYGTDRLKRLATALRAVYKERDSPLQNEFAHRESIRDKNWKFMNYTLKEFVWQQKRKQIYGTYRPTRGSRTIKVEFEPVKRWNEIQNEYNRTRGISRKGWVKLRARVVDANEAMFMPAVYHIEPVKILKGTSVDNLRRIVSFVEEFRLQAEQDELVVAEGNLEQVTTPSESFQQVTLTYGPRYYEQTLKVVR